MKHDYTYDEVRQMLRWEIEEERKKLVPQPPEESVDATIAAMTDDILRMWENAGLTSKNDFQLRVERWRNRDKIQ